MFNISDFSSKGWLVGGPNSQLCLVEFGGDHKGGHQDHQSIGYQKGPK